MAFEVDVLLAGIDNCVAVDYVAQLGGQLKEGKISLESET